MKKTEELDHKILDLLQEDSRRSYRDIAKQLDVSHVNVSHRVKAMEQQGIIRGYTTVLSPDAMNLYPLCLRISAESGTDLAEVGRKVADYSDIQVVLRVSGDCELLALAMCRNRHDAVTLLDQISAVPGIEKAESHVVLEAMKLSGKRL